jgi:hypothetical protein
MEGTESITSLLARIPPTSIPRRKNPGFGDISGVRPPPDSLRDMRGTNLSFESGSIAKGWTKNVTVPAVGVAILFAMAVLIKIVRASTRPTRQPVTIQAVEPPPMITAPPPPMPVVLAPPATTYVPAPTAPMPIALAPATADPLPAAPKAAGSDPTAAAPPKPKAPKHAPAHKEPKEPKEPAPAPAPAPQPAPGGNPKLL